MLGCPDVHTLRSHVHAEHLEEKISACSIAHVAAMNDVCRDALLDQESTCKQGKVQENGHHHLAQVPPGADAVVLLTGGPLSFGWLFAACLIAANATIQQNTACRHMLHHVVLAKECICCKHLGLRMARGL